MKVVHPSHRHALLNAVIIHNVPFLHVHREEAGRLDLKEIACMFVAAKERRTSFFGHFV